MIACPFVWAWGCIPECGEFLNVLLAGELNGVTVRKCFCGFDGFDKLLPFGELGLLRPLIGMEVGDQSGLVCLLVSCLSVPTCFAMLRVGLGVFMCVVLIMVLMSVAAVLCLAVRLEYTSDCFGYLLVCCMSAVVEGFK